MKVSKLSLTVFLTAGAVLSAASLRAQTNAPASTNAAAPAGPRINRSVMGEGRVASLTQKLNLTADQQAKLRVVFDAEYKAIQDTPRAERREKFPSIEKETHDRIKEILTEEQFAKYEALPPRGPVTRR